MRKLKIITIWSILAFIVLNNLLKVNYYKHLFTGDLYFGPDVGKLLHLSGAVFVFLFDILYLVLGIMAVGASDKATQDRAYSLLRFIFIVQSLINFPLSAIQTITYAKYTFAVPVTAVTILIRYAIWITLVVLLIICKPEKQIQRVNLQQFDMVAFTSTGHRFVHYLLDILFLLPMWVHVLQILVIDSNATEFMANALRFIFGTSYLLYCFLSEAIFKQTFGKMVTRSCVASDGVELSTGRIFRRTMARLIPFDAISFLFGAKWHDRLSATAVVYVDSWYKAFEDEKAPRF